MKHSVVCRLGAADIGKIKTRPGDQVTDVPFIAAKKRLDHGLGGALEFLAAKGFQPSERAVDLLIIAGMVMAADTRIKRSANAQDKWTREIDVHVPVSDATVWTSQSDLLQRILGFLTGDRWRLFFRSRPATYKEFVPMPKRLRIEEPTSICLLSGGLDSFIGAIDLLSAGEKPLLVSHWWDGTTSTHQTYCVGRLEAHFPTFPLMHLRGHIGFPADTVASKSGEETQRGRSFLFFALASLAADSLKRMCVVYVPENGLISLNVPLDPLRLGALSTRTTHPFYMARWNDLLKGIGVAATLVNPYRFQTKGAMVDGCKDKAFLKKTAKHTMSCSHPDAGRWQGESPGHCGRCVPCLIRRGALNAGLGLDDTNYKIPDLAAVPRNSRTADGADIRSFQVAIARLKRRPGIENRLIHQPGPLSDYPDADIKRYAAMYKAGMAEVERILKGVDCRPL